MIRRIFRSKPPDGVSDHVEPLDVDRPDRRWYEPPATTADIRRALINLPSRERTALVMRDFERRSHEEICQALGISEEALQELLDSARWSARALLAGQMASDEAGRKRPVHRPADGDEPALRKPPAPPDATKPATKPARRQRRQPTNTEPAGEDEAVVRKPPAHPDGTSALPGRLRDGLAGLRSNSRHGMVRQRANPS